MKKQANIILNNGISITITDKDTFKVQDIDEVNTLQELCRFILSRDYETCIIENHLHDGSYLEYYLSRDKITWCYYSELKDEDNSN